MSDDPTHNLEPVVIEVDTEPVPGVLELDDVVGMLQALRDEAAQPRSLLRFGPRPEDPGGAAAQETERVPADVAERLEAVNQLADELAEQLAQLARARREG